MKRSLLTITLLLSIVTVLVLSCEKDKSAGNGVPPPPPPPGAPPSPFPKLPATPFNYANLESEIPAYIRSYLQSHPEMDNMPANNPITNDGATLGRVLFYDRLLSVNNKISCASCHHAERGFADQRQFPQGFEDKLTRRNSLGITNLRYFKAKKMFWDLRAEHLEMQSLMPIQDKIEMGMPSLAALEDKLRQTSYYPNLFKAAFGSTEINADKISKALSQFMRSIISFKTKYDDGVAINFSNFTAQEKAGFDLVKRLNCVECHSDLASVAAKSNPTFLQDDNFGLNTFGMGTNNGLDQVYTDNGIGEITKEQKDMGTFKIPMLRNVELTGPYMHDGRFQTLEQVLEHYNTGAKAHPNRGIQIPNGGYKFLTQQDKQNIISFLRTLTDHSLASNPKYSDPFR